MRAMLLTDLGTGEEGGATQKGMLGKKQQVDLRQGSDLPLADVSKAKRDNGKDSSSSPLIGCRQTLLQRWDLVGLRAPARPEVPISEWTENILLQTLSPPSGIDIHRRLFREGEIALRFGKTMGEPFASSRTSLSTADRFKQASRWALISSWTIIAPHMGHGQRIFISSLLSSSVNSSAFRLTVSGPNMVSASETCKVEKNSTLALASLRLTLSR